MGLCTGRSRIPGRMTGRDREGGKRCLVFDTTNVADSATFRGGCVALVSGALGLFQAKGRNLEVICQW